MKYRIKIYTYSPSGKKVFCPQVRSWFTWMNIYKSGYKCWGYGTENEHDDRQSALDVIDAYHALEMKAKETVTIDFDYFFLPKK